MAESSQDYGVSVQRARRNGARWHAVYLDQWTWPETGLLFPATRKDSKVCYHSKDVVAAAIRKVRSTFVPPDGAGSVRIENIVSHCGRHRCSNDMKSFGIKREVGKKFARISTDKVWDGYGPISQEQVGKQFAANVELQRNWKSMYPEFLMHNTSEAGGGGRGAMAASCNSWG